MTASPVTAPARSVPPARYDIDAVLRDIGDVPVITDPQSVRRR